MAFVFGPVPSAAVGESLTVVFSDETVEGLSLADCFLFDPGALGKRSGGEGIGGFRAEESE